MEKRTLTAIKATLALLLAAVVVGCGGQTAGQGAQDGEQPDGGQPVRGQFLTGSVGGVYDILGGGMANVINENTENVRLNPSNPPSVSVVPQQINSGQAVFGLAQIDQVERAVEGTGEFDQAYPNLRVVMGLYENVMSQVVLENSPITNISEAEGLRIGVPSETTQGLVAGVYEVAGVPEDQVEWVYLTYAETAAALKDGDIDIGTFTGYPKNGTVEELASTEGIRFLDVDEEVQEQWNEEQPLNAFRTIPGGTYPGVEEDATFYTVFAHLITSSEVPEDGIYRITKAILENQDDIAAVHPAGEQVSPEITEEWIDDAVLDPDLLHPGARRYFEEIGVDLEPTPAGAETTGD
jgi:TRAP transporter TAXI family solute receptor